MPPRLSELSELELSLDSEKLDDDVLPSDSLDSLDELLDSELEDSLYPNELELLSELDDSELELLMSGSTDTGSLTQKRGSPLNVYLQILSDSTYQKVLRA